MRRRETQRLTGMKREIRSARLGPGAPVSMAKGMGSCTAGSSRTGHGAATGKQYNMVPLCGQRLRPIGYDPFGAGHRRLSVSLAGAAACEGDGCYQRSAARVACAIGGTFAACGAPGQALIEQPDGCIPPGLAVISL